MDKDIFKDRKDALEEDYFRKKNQELINRMKERLTGEGSIHETSFDCPKCDGKLHTGNFEDVQIDICDKCSGVWLDSGELERILGKKESSWVGRLFGD